MQAIMRWWFCLSRLGATVEVVLAGSHNCPPELRPDLYNKGYATLTTFGTATSRG